MKKQSKELEVDIIGGEGPLTIEEEKLVSAFIQKNMKVSPIRQRTTKKKEALKARKSTIS